MAKGICLAVGLNVVDTSSPDYRGARIPALEGCVNDAVAVADLVHALPGYVAPTVLTNDQATHDAVLARVDAAAHDLEPGDLFVFHYSGHGMKGAWDANGRPDPDAEASSWVLYDRPLGHDELYRHWAPFRNGVRILVLSDSCHSGSAIRNLGAGGGYRVRGLERDARRRVLENQHALFRERSLREGVLRSDGGAPGAAILLISGCQFAETSLDTVDRRGKPHGLFTATLLDVWDRGRFAGDYAAFHRQVAEQTDAQSRRIDPSHRQNPNFFPLGSPVDVAVFAGSSPPFMV